VISERSTVRPEELASWREFIGRSEVRRDVIDAATLRRFAAAVGSTAEVEREPPPLAHWAFFCDVAATDQLGPDGHPSRGSGLYPPVSLPRRLFASSTIKLVEPLIIGEEAELTLRVLDVKHRVGKSGDIVLLDLERRLRQQARLRVMEQQTIVYRESSTPMAPIAPDERQAMEAERLWTPRSVELFRFSAVTFNAHRIHYDERYATQIEGYPGLVVQGPLTAIKLFAFAQGRLPRPIRQFCFRAVAPLFVEQPAALVIDSEPNRVACIRCDGEIAMSATVSMETPFDVG
jgi:3-methylfumaryl-CoA hydratase